LDFSPKSANRRLVSTDQLRLPSPTNKAVNPIRRSSAGVQAHMNHNDRGTICQNTDIASTRFFALIEIKFRGFPEKSCQSQRSVRRRICPAFEPMGYL
jgi:hypothetical protein